MIIKSDSRLILVAWVSLLIYAGAFAQSISRVAIRTRAENNRNASVWYRVPENYREISGRKWRVLVIFGGRNCGGSNEVSNAIGWAKSVSLWNLLTSDRWFAIFAPLVEN